jgi:glycerol-3-phosphate acyltransferase PlsY
MNFTILALFWLAFAFILRSKYEERSLIFITIIAIIAHYFPAYFSLYRLYKRIALIPNILTLLFSLNLAILPALVITLLLLGVMEVLLIGIIITLY